MSVTPLDGPPMGMRCGAIDALISTRKSPASARGTPMDEDAVVASETLDAICS